MTCLVLVHGGSRTSTAWDLVLEHLTTPAHAIDLPGRRYRPADLGRIGRHDWEASAAADIVALDLADVVLVGHSAAGYVIPGIARLLPPGTVRHLVFLASTCPKEGATPAESLVPRLRELSERSEAYLREAAKGKTLAGLREGEPMIQTDLEVVEIEPTMGLECPAQLFEPMTWIDVPDVPHTYIRALGDKVIPPEHALLMAANADAEVIDIDANHDVATSAPGALAALLDDLAQRS